MRSISARGSVTSAACWVVTLPSGPHRTAARARSSRAPWPGGGGRARASGRVVLTRSEDTRRRSSNSIAHPLAGAPAAPRRAAISASASAASIEVSTCEPWGPVGSACQPSSAGAQAAAHGLLAARVALDRAASSTARRAGGVAGRRPAGRAARAGRTAGRSPSPTPGCRAARTPSTRLAGALERCRTRSGARAAAPRPRSARRTPSAARAPFTWSCGPTDTPPRHAHHVRPRDGARERRRAWRPARPGPSRPPPRSRPRAVGLGGERGGVRAPDPARARAAAPGSTSSSPVARQPEPRPARAARARRGPTLAQHAERRGAEPRSRRGARCRPPARPRPRGGCWRPAAIAGTRNPPVALLDALDRHHRGGALGHGGAGRDPDRRARERRAAAPGGPRATPRRSARSPSASGGRAKPSIAEVSKGGTSTALVTSSASTRPSASAQRHLLSRQRAHRCQDEPPGLVDRHASGHARILPATGAAMASGAPVGLAFRPYPCLVWLRPAQEDVACPTQTAVPTLPSAGLWRASIARARSWPRRGWCA